MACRPLSIPDALHDCRWHDQPGLLISEKVTLTEAAELLPRMNQFPGTGVTVIDRFC
jgi:hypothetical protein